MTFTINNGLAANYGPRDGKDAITRHKKDYLRHIEVSIDFQNLPVNPQDIAGLMQEIPSESIITRCHLVSLTAWTSTSGTTTLNVGLRKRDGTTISAAGLFSATTVASLTANKVTTSSGTLINNTVGLDDAYPVITPSAADLTAGTGKLIIEYLAKGMVQ